MSVNTPVEYHTRWKSMRESHRPADRSRGFASSLLLAALLVIVVLALVVISQHPAVEQPAEANDAAGEVEFIMTGECSPYGVLAPCVVTQAKNGPPV